jgi:hypothetical protein
MISVPMGPDGRASKSELSFTLFEKSEIAALAALALSNAKHPGIKNRWVEREKGGEALIKQKIRTLSI